MLIKYTVPHDLVSTDLPREGSGSRSVSNGAYSVGIEYVSGQLQVCNVQYTDKKGTHEKRAYRCLEDYEAVVRIGGSRHSISAKRDDILFPYTPYPILSFQVI